MTPKQVQQMIQQALAKNSQANRFNMSFVPRHIHNNIDSPYALQPILSYGGNITATGSINFLPLSWSITHPMTGTFVINHNLNTLLYVAYVVPQGTEGVGVGIVQALNTLSISLFNVANLDPIDQPFTFMLTNLSNRTVKIPRYHGSLLSKNQYPPPF